MKYLNSILFNIVLLTMFLFAQNGNQKPCSSPEAKQFDFWIGEWDLTWQDKDGNTLTGSNSISKILNSCVIEENFTGGEFIGKSFSVYNPVKKLWQQTWVDNEGSYLEFAGGFEDGKMILFREITTKENKKIKQRMIFYNISENQLDWNWEKSTDNGKTWQLAWKIHYTRKVQKQ